MAGAALQNAIIDIDALTIRLIFTGPVCVRCDAPLTDGGDPLKINDFFSLNWDGVDYVLQRLLDVTQAAFGELLFAITADTPHFATDPGTISYQENDFGVLEDTDGSDLITEFTNFVITAAATGNPQVSYAFYNVNASTLNVSYDQTVKFFAPPSGVYQFRTAAGAYMCNKDIIAFTDDGILFTVQPFPATGQPAGTILSIGAANFVFSEPDERPALDCNGFALSE